MEKALNTLKDLNLVINFNSYWKPRVDEAIAELEEAMKPKSCDGCSHLFFDEIDEVPYMRCTKVENDVPILVRAKE